MTERTTETREAPTMSEAQRERIREDSEAATDWTGTYRCCGKPFLGTLREARSGTHACEKPHETR